MAITRVTNFTSGTLAYPDLNSEFNNIVNYINNRVLSNPLTQDIDFNDLYTITNLRSFWEILNADEYESLSSAIDALPAGGGAIFIPPGITLDISTTVTIDKDNVVIFGAGPSSVLRMAGGASFSATDECMLKWDDRANCALYNLQLDGQQSAGPSNGICGARVMGTSIGFNFYNLYVRRFGDSSSAVAAHGIRVGEDTSATPNGVTVRGCRFDNVYASSIKVDGGRNVKILGNEVAYSTILTASTGIRVEDAGNGRFNDIVISGNTVGNADNRSDEGIYVRADDAAGSTPSTLYRNVTITGNSVDSTDAHGIYVENFFGAVVADNNIHRPCSVDASSNGISIQGCVGITVSGNTLSEVGEALSNGSARPAGIYVTSAAGQPIGMGIQIVGNTLYKSAGSGIEVEVGTEAIRGLTLSNNFLTQYDRKDTDSVVEGIHINATSGSIADVSITGNTLYLNTTPAGTTVHGIRFTTAGGNTITNVIVLGNNLADSDGGTTPSEIFGADLVTNYEVGHNWEN